MISFAFPYEQVTSFADSEIVDHHHCNLDDMTVEEMVLYLTMDHCTNGFVPLQDPLEMEMVPLMDEEKSLMDEAMSLRDGVTLSSCDGFEVSSGCCALMNDSYLD